MLVNNAGMAILGEMDTLTELEQVSSEQWHRSLERNLTTAFMVTRAFLPGMKRHAYGRIVHISSTTGGVSAVAGDSAYAAAKAGMVGLTRAVALEGGAVRGDGECRGAGLDCHGFADGAGGRRRASVPRSGALERRTKWR